MAAICNDRLLHYQVLDGAGNHIAFSHFIYDLGHQRDIQGLPQDSILVMDNVAFHRNQLSRETMNNRGFTYKFLTPYSPYLNPIENMFFQWKNLVKRTESNNEQELIQNIHRINEIITADHCSNYFRHCAENAVKILDKIEKD